MSVGSVSSTTTHSGNTIFTHSQSRGPFGKPDPNNVGDVLAYRLGQGLRASVEYISSVYQQFLGVTPAVTDDQCLNLDGLQKLTGLDASKTGGIVGAEGAAIDTPFTGIDHEIIYVDDGFKFEQLQYKSGNGDRHIVDIHHDKREWHRPSGTIISPGPSAASHSQFSTGDAFLGLSEDGHYSGTYSVINASGITIKSIPIQFVNINTKNLFLLPSPSIRSDDPRVQRVAQNLVKDAKTTKQKLEKIYKWTIENVKIISGGRRENEAHKLIHNILDKKSDMNGGLCKQFSRVFVALCRAAGVQSRMVSIADHVWAEVKVGGRWKTVDVLVHAYGKHLYPNAKSESIPHVFLADDHQEVLKYQPTLVKEIISKEERPFPTIVG